MKLKKLVLKKNDVAFSLDEHSRITALVRLLIQIDTRVKLCNKKTQKKKSTKSSKISSITLGSHNRGPNWFIIEHLTTCSRFTNVATAVATFH